MSAIQMGARYASPLLFLLIGWSSVFAEVYQTPQDFIAEQFAAPPPQVKKLWLSGERKEIYREVMDEAPRQLRLRYWQQNERTVWILEAVGKEHPITAGFIVEKGRLQQARVLAFRESRGWEIRYPFFTDQFRGIGLHEGQQLDGTIDTITGATLSVRAMSRMARMALMLHNWVNRKDDTP